MFCEVKYYKLTLLNDFFLKFSLSAIPGVSLDDYELLEVVVWSLFINITAVTYSSYCHIDGIQYIANVVKGLRIGVRCSLIAQGASYVQCYREVPWTLSTL